MRLVLMADLCKQLGIPRRTFQDWVKKDPSLAVLLPGPRGSMAYYIRIDRLAGRHGIGPIDAYLLPRARWIRATELAQLAGKSRWTVQDWCRKRPGLGKRIGRNYWVDLDQLGASEEEIQALLGGLGEKEDDQR